MRILIFETDRDRAESLETFLKGKGFVVDKAYDSVSGTERALSGIHDIILLDMMMPELDVFELLRKIRAKHQKTAIVLGYDDADMRERIRGLNAGADYCLSKNTEHDELLACINAYLRRNEDEGETLSYGNTHIDLSTCELVNGTKKVHLSWRELDVMRILMEAKEQVVSKERILSSVWGLDSNAVENHVEAYIGFIRKKLAAIDSNVRIVAIRRVGYHLETDQA